jgi:hypothetical protein
MNRLTQQKINELGGAMQRLAELNTKAIKESTDASEARGLQTFLTANTLPHLEEFIACWLTVEGGYKPLLQGFSGLLSSAFQVIAARERAQQQVAPEAANKENQGLGGSLKAS